MSLIMIKLMMTTTFKFEKINYKNETTKPPKNI